ncbi:MAG: zf-HC2 domain-containing protein, partial [Acidobacteria bacterium]|nr:zf-HC2 domain-containing protein [Acidobacteriota bacterium]
MSCLPELTYFIYADGELSPEEARRVEAHLLTCARCRALVEGLRAENAFLTEALLEVDEAVLPTARGFRLLDLAWTTAVVLIVAGSAQVAYSWFTDVETPAGTSWLNPFNLGVQVQLFFTSLFYLLREGASMLASLTTTVSALLLAVGFIAGATLLWRRRQTPRFMLVTFSLLAALGLAQPAGAVEHRSQKKGDIIIRADEVIDDTLIIHAEHVTVDGTVTGNLIVFCGDLTMNGTVKGDLLSFSGNVRIKGTVEGNAFIFAGNTEVSGKVGESLHVFTGSFTLPQGGEVAGDAFAFTGAAIQEGEVKRDLVTFAGATILSGGVGRHVRAHTEALQVKASAR